MFFFIINVIKNNMRETHAIKITCVSYIIRDTCQFYM
jgi:hypothetical protein